MRYAEALVALENGHRIARAGWNGKGMWLKLISNYLIEPDEQINAETGDYYPDPDNVDGGLKLLPWIGIKTADNKFVPWLCSQTDALTKDWEIVN